MGWYIYVHGTATIDPPLPDLARRVADEADDYGEWLLSEEGDRIEDPCGAEWKRADQLRELVTAIRAQGSRVSGVFRCKTSEGYTGKWVIDGDGVAEYNGFLAYDDGTTDEPGVLIGVSKDFGGETIKPVGIVYEYAAIDCDDRWRIIAYPNGELYVLGPGDERAFKVDSWAMALELIRG